MDDEYDPAIMVEHLKNYERVYHGTQKEVLAYTVKQYLLLAIKSGQPELVLKDPRFEFIFMEAQLATSCGWTPENSGIQTISSSS
jgi:hypothetical protein